MNFVLLVTTVLFTSVTGVREIPWTDLMNYGQQILITRLRDLDHLAPRETLVRIQLDEGQGDDLKNLTESFLGKVQQIFSGNDPFDYEGTSINYNGYGVILEVTGENLIISGFSSFAYNNLQVVQGEQLKIGMNLIFSGLQITGSYDINSNILSMFPIYGNGTFGVKSTQLEIDLLVNLEQTNSTKILQITDAQFGVSLRGTKVDLKNIYYRPGLSTLISNIVNDVASSTLTTGTEGIPLINSLFNAELNSVMMAYQVTLEKIIAFIKYITQ